MSIIPNVADVIRASKKSEDVKKCPSFSRLEKAGVEFKEYLKKEICDQLDHYHAQPGNQCHVDMRFKTLGLYQGIPGDVLLYGHRKSTLVNEEDWYQRSDLGLAEMPFRILQREFLEQGWYLIEVTDPLVSREFVFKVYAGEPKNHHYYNQPNLWHYHNFVFPPKSTVKPTKVEVKNIPPTFCKPSVVPCKAMWSFKKMAQSLPSWDLPVDEDESKTKTETPSKPPAEKRKRPAYYVCTTKDAEAKGPDFRRFKIVNPEYYGLEKKSSRFIGHTLLEAAKKAFIRIADRYEIEAPYDHYVKTFSLEEHKKGCPPTTFKFLGRRILLEESLYIAKEYGKSEEVKYEYDVVEIKKEEYDSMPELSETQGEDKMEIDDEKQTYQERVEIVDDQ